MLPFTPVFAADFGPLIGLAVLVISILSWIVNIIKSASAEAPKPAEGRRPERRPDKLRSEIEEFLEELTKPGQTRPPKEPRPTAPSGPSPRRPSNKQQRPPQPPAKKAKSAPAPAKAERPGSTLSGRHLETPALGSNVREHVSTHMAADRVIAAAEQDLGHRIDAAVQHDLGAPTATSVTTTSRPPHPLLVALRSPGGVRQAVLLHEILQRPKALRRN